MLKHIIISAALLAVVGQTVFLPTQALYLELNRAVLAQKYCINRDKPMLNCDGKCILARRLAEAVQQDIPGANPEAVILSFELALYWTAIPEWRLHQAPARHQAAKPTLNPVWHPADYAATILKPPRSGAPV